MSLGNLFNVYHELNYTTQGVTGNERAGDYVTPSYRDADQTSLFRRISTSFGGTRSSVRSSDTRSKERVTALPGRRTRSSLTESTDGYTTAEEEQRMRDLEVLRLARQATARADRTTKVEGLNPFRPEKDSDLDPTSPNFHARSWAKALLHLQSGDPNQYPRRTAGFAFGNLNAYGYGVDTNYQKTVGNQWLGGIGFVKRLLRIGNSGRRKVDILQGLDGIVEAGEMLLVLGPPGSGCTTFLKTISGETDGFTVDKDSFFNYQGIGAKQMHSDFRGEAIYTAETDVHFPTLTVGNTLAFAAESRSPRNIPGGVSRREYALLLRDVWMATFGISHTVDTRVGNDVVRGITGGERKRVTIAEAALSQAPLQCWDNSTRGLDSADTIEFCKTLRMSTDILGATACVSMYQTPQEAYKYFDKVIVLYEGRQIFFGKIAEARRYFINMGFKCPHHQTDADFLTSMTSPQERLVRNGYESRVPRTPDEFASQWKASSNYVRLLRDLFAYEHEFAMGGEHLHKFAEAKRAVQAKQQRRKSPYTLSYSQQVNLCLRRAWWRLRASPSQFFMRAIYNALVAMVVASVFFNLQPITGEFFARGSLLYFSLLLNALGAAFEILIIFAQRPIVEKHARYAFYHPSAEAVASMLSDLPYKVLNILLSSIVLYFMTNLHRTPGAFFFFMLISFFALLSMSMLFRTVASVARTLEQALVPAALIVLSVFIYTGFAIPTTYMPGWSRWINYANPVAWAFESIMLNEFHGRNFTCSRYVPFGPAYDQGPAEGRICRTMGTVLGQDFVDGGANLALAFDYHNGHKWRNFGVLVAFVAHFLATYLWAAETVKAKKSKSGILIFPRKVLRKLLSRAQLDDVEDIFGDRPIKQQVEKTREVFTIQKQTSILHWSDLTYDIKVTGGQRRLLDFVDGWVKPGTLTAVMGEHGAGKTLLLDLLAARKTTGIISGDILVDSRVRDASFQRNTGYVQQQDVHLASATVREALVFSALLRQPAGYTYEEKMAYVDEVIGLLDMEEYADAVIGVPGEELNVEQRKRVTIGVELAARPELLLFLDEPTSGLDSQTSWAICDLLEKLAKSGQAILCTLHQPSAMVFQRFDRLLFLAKGGKPVYFGEIGPNSRTLTHYFERAGSSRCPREANPAEWIFEIIGAAPGSSTSIDWPQVWRDSPELREVKRELQTMEKRPGGAGAGALPVVDLKDIQSHREFATPFIRQLYYCTKRVFEQYWRSPVYIYSKAALVLFSGLLVGFSFFRAQNSQQGLQNQLFGIFILMTVSSQLVQQIHPQFINQRAVYEARERPSKAYSWKAFLIANILVEIPWQTLMSVILYFTWYYPVGLWRNAEATGAVTLRGVQAWLVIWQYMLYISTFAHMTVAGVKSAEKAGKISNLLYLFSIIFCGVLSSRRALPGFWDFMYRLSPFTYFVSTLMSTSVANTGVTCAENEYLRFKAQNGQTCEEYLRPYFQYAPGYLNPATAQSSQCEVCPLDSTNQFLSVFNISYGDYWRNYGILWGYIGFNLFMTVSLYWLARVPKKKGLTEQEAKKAA